MLSSAGLISRIRSDEDLPVQVRAVARRQRLAGDELKRPRAVGKAFCAEEQGIVPAVREQPP